jgi:hypothetical protein
MDTKTAHVNTIIEPNPEFVVIVSKSNDTTDLCLCSSCCRLCVLMVLVIIITIIVSIALRKEN